MGLAWLLVSVIVLWLVAPVLLFRFLGPMEARGQFGDMFGSINALFSALAFAVLIYTMWLQRAELALQRQELVQTREQLRRSAEAHEQAKQVLEGQAKVEILAAYTHAMSLRLEFALHKQTPPSDLKDILSVLEEGMRDKYISIFPTKNN